MITITLKDWYYRQTSSKPSLSDIDITPWFKCRNDTYGNQIHLDLLNNGHIPDPLIDDNEKKVQWVGNSDWEYKTDFKVENYDPMQSYHLVFEGLDTFATITLNKVELISTDNSFRTYTVDVTHSIKAEDNDLRILFKSNLKIARKIEHDHGKYACWNGETSRLHVRKPQYHFGWDWGPLLLTCGPWKPVKLVSGILVNDFFIGYSLSEFLNMAEITIEIDLKLSASLSPNSLVVKVHDSDNNLIDNIVTHTVKSKTKIHYSIKTPQLWYPRYHGNQDQYKFELFVDEEKLDEKLVGFRKVELIQDKDDTGKSFYFKINDIPVFIMGSNWIPAHSFTSALTCNDYEEWMNLLVKGNQNLIRIWGGGIYEHEDLYKICDSKGILIWHDLMFACGLYPAYHSFVDNVKQEIEDQLKRLRKFSSIIIIAGNNEDYQVAESLKIKHDHSDFRKFPARILYEDVFPHLVKTLTNGIPYQRGSPYSGLNHISSDPTRGDLHQWNVWHGSQEPYQDWDKLSGRFVSEFGMLALPNFKTLDKALSDKSQLFPQSYLMDHHNKSAGFERRLALYVMENFALPVNFNLKNWIYITQLMQSDCLTLAYRYWRRQWQDFKCGGAIVWQLNDCWPVTSWSIIDFNKIPKLAYYGIKRECSLEGIGCYRNLQRVGDPDEPEDLSKQTPLHDYVKEYKTSLDIWGFSNKSHEGLSLEVYLYDTKGNAKSNLKFDDIKLLGNNCTQSLLDKLIDINLKNDTIIQILLKNNKGEIIGRTNDWCKPIKYLVWNDWYKDLDLNYELVVDGKIKLTTNKPIKCLEIYFENNSNEAIANVYEFSDNGFDLFPNDERIIEIKGLNESLLQFIKFNHL
ncbi:family 2 glycoside hydrolase [Scheffersomyces coipomensis]|uniref:family 2 glycoside hydrolase n=1 Tax=Scheffersomyces coipomensis TaxID=1788519 RepID=UPI00315D5B44